MPIWKLQTTIWSDSVLARDGFTITPHFNDAGATTDPQGLCDDLSAAISQWAQGNSHQVEVKAYDAQGATPVYPQGSKMRNVGSSPGSPLPREIALCLSFYADRNIPRHRGRLYIPAGILSNLAAVRPQAAQQQKVADLAPIFGDLGGVDVDWCVYSRADNVARPVENWWVDDEWDTVRSRGLRATSRLTGTTSEA